MFVVQDMTPFTGPALDILSDLDTLAILDCVPPLQLPMWRDIAVPARVEQSSHVRIRHRKSYKQNCMMPQVRNDFGQSPMKDRLHQFMVISLGEDHFAVSELAFPR